LVPSKAILQTQKSMGDFELMGSEVLNAKLIAENEFLKLHNMKLQELIKDLNEKLVHS